MDHKVFLVRPTGTGSRPQKGVSRHLRLTDNGISISGILPSLNQSPEFYSFEHISKALPSYMDSTELAIDVFGGYNRSNEMLKFYCDSGATLLTALLNKLDDGNGIEDQCYICKMLGHLCRIDIVDGCQRDISCYNCGEFGHSGMGYVKSKKGKTKEGSARVCYICGEEGHIARGCKKTNKCKLGKRKREHEKDDNAFFGFKSVPHHGKVSSLQETPKKCSNYAKENGQAGDDLSRFKLVPRNFGKLSSSSKSLEKCKAETTGRCKSQWKKGKEEVSNNQSANWASPKRNLSSSLLKMPENNNHSANENARLAVLFLTSSFLHQLLFTLFYQLHSVYVTAPILREM